MWTLHSSRLRWLVIAATTSFAACSSTTDDAVSEIGEWLRAAAGFNATPEALACTEAAAEDLLSDDDERVWLAHDPETINVEQLQELPHAIEMADRCRHLLTGPLP